MLEKPSKEDTEYWDNVLHDHGLGMNRGRRRWLIYGHEDQEKNADALLPEESE